MPQLELYEKKILQDEELPIQLSNDVRNGQVSLFSSHWHEHIELHHVVHGEADMYLNQTHYQVGPGNIMIANCNELHSGFCRKAPYYSNVIIVDMADLSRELAKSNYIFQSIIPDDPTLQQLITRIFQEKRDQQRAYKQICRALVLELLVYLCRNYVTESLPEKDSQKRKRNLERLNTVLYYIERHFNERISNAQLAELVCLSEDRFEHLFREGVGMSPLQYINDMRLKKAMHLLASDEHTVTEVAKTVGFQDYNHFGRLFRKRYGYTPRDVKSGRMAAEEEKKNSGIV